MNIVIVGHIDHGKSTLIGRLLYDTNSIPDSIIEEVKANSTDGSIEFAYFLDCLEEERAQNITIDTTQTFFKSDVRRYIIIDAPGHREFLKNMVSGASLAEAAVLMVDVGRGMEEQTRRHASILRLLGIERVIVAINKMDSVDYSKAKFVAVREDVLGFLEKLKIRPVEVIPVAAKTGDSVTSRSSRMPWYQGPSLLEALDALASDSEATGTDVRFPIQDIYQIDGDDIAVGRIESGTLKKGDELKIAPKGLSAKVESIRVMGGTLASADAGKCIGVVLNPSIPVSRGEVSFDGKPPRSSSSLKTVVFSLSDKAIQKGDTLYCQCGTQSVACHVEDIREKIDSSTLDPVSANQDRLDPTQVAKLTLSFSEPLIYDTFKEVPALGRFVLTDQGDICAAGIISE